MNGCYAEPQPTEVEVLNQTAQDKQNNNLDPGEKFCRKKPQKKYIEKKREIRIKSGNVFIVAFKNLLQETKATKEVACRYLDQVLHSIFFLGHLNEPPISPDEFLPGQLIEQFRKLFPKAFREYTTHLPHYTPYSILLEYMTESLKPEDPRLFWKKLEDVNASLMFHNEEGVLTANAFVASVVSYCCVKDFSGTKVLKEAYGSSISCKGNTQREIMIFTSALHVWDRAVSYAVCSAGNGPPITFPKEVHCYAYNFKLQREIPPCTKCIEMYVVKFCPEPQELKEKPKWPYGNCAENEALSRLLKSDKDVRKNICIIGDGEKVKNRDDIENRFKENYEDETKSKVEQLLTSLKLNLTLGEWNFYTPLMAL